MHVLIFSWFYPPYLSAGASRLGQLALYLSRLGIRVSVVTGRPSDLPPISDIAPAAEVHHAPALDLNAPPRLLLGRRSVVEHGYELSRLGRFSALGQAYKQVIHVPDAQAGWIVPAVRLAARLDRPDVVLSSLPPPSAHLAAALFALRRGIPWVAEYRSPWTDSLYFRRWWPAQPIERAVEVWAGRRAAAVTAISEYLQGVVSRRLRRPVAFVPNGFDPDDYPGEATPEGGLFVHLGSVYAPYRTDVLVEALAQVRRPARAVFLGRNLANLPARLRTARGRELVETPGPVRRSDAIGWIRRAEANLLFLTERPGSPQYADVPQKLYEYMAAGRPILAIGPAGSETADLARRTGLASFARTPAELARSLEDVPPVAPDPVVLAEHRYDRIAARFAEIFRSAR